jgi:tryptophan synthase beta chain
MNEAIKFILPDDRLPKVWYNLPADLPQPLPPILNAATGKPVGVEELTPLFPMSEILQEVSTEREIEIPGPVRDVYRLWRPTPLRRALSLERLLDTPARIFYKDESVGLLQRADELCDPAAEQGADMKKVAEAFVE